MHFPTTILAAQHAADLRAVGADRRGRPRREQSSQTSRGEVPTAGPPVPRLALRARFGR